MIKKIITATALCALALSTIAQRRVSFQNDRDEPDVVERVHPERWANLVNGGEFIDRFKPMPNGQLSSDVWGGDNVLPRYIDNGIEDDTYSFWGGNIIRDSVGIYHLFVCGWLEDNPRGHRMWGKSLLFHSTCDNSIGPYSIIDTIGYGHNVDTFQIADGSYVSYNISLARGGRTAGYYHSPTLNGEWKYHELECVDRDRKINVKSNFSFTERADGSILAVGKDGKMWISRDGLNPYMLLTDYSVYPDIAGFMEDPEIWRDNVQYNMVVNDAKGRVAYYGRSRNGVDWIWEDGIAYRPGRLSVHNDGTVEDWHKYERVKILQDQEGRAIQANFAVMDIDKELDKGGDIHSAKNISIPIRKGLLIEWCRGNISHKNPVIKIKKENQFDPAEQVDVSSLRLGNYNAVSYGGGSKAIRSRVVNGDLLVTFDGDNHNLKSSDFAAKLLGFNNNGELLYGYVRLPWCEYDGAILSPLAPTLSTNGISIVVENWGLTTSAPAKLRIVVDSVVIGSASISSIEPYSLKSVEIRCANPPTNCDVEIFIENEQVCLFHTTIHK